MLGRRLEPAELRALLVRPLPGRVVLLYFGVGEGFAVVLLGFELGVLVDFFDLVDQVVVLYFLHQAAQVGSVAVLDLFDELIGEEVREVAVVDRGVGVHGRQYVIPQLHFRTFQSQLDLFENGIYGVGARLAAFDG